MAVGCALFASIGLSPEALASAGPAREGADRLEQVERSVRITQSLAAQQAVTDTSTISPTTVGIEQLISSLPVDVFGLETTQNYLLPFVRDEVSVWMTLSARSGQPLTLTAPTLVSLALQTTDQTSVQAQFERVGMVDDQGQVLADTLVLAPGQPERVQLTVYDLSRVGVYNGMVQIGAAGAVPIREPVTFLVKRWWGTAAGIILMGVLIGFGLSVYSTAFRPRLIGQRQLLALRQNLETVIGSLGRPPAGDAGRQEADVSATVQRNISSRLATLEADLQLGMADTNGQTGLGELATRLDLLPVWVKYHRIVAALQPPELREPFRARLDEAQGLLVAPLPATDPANAAAEAKTAAGKLNSLDGEIEQAIRTKLGSQIEALRADVQQALDAFDSPERDSILAALDQAHTQLDADLAQARQLFDTARVDYARLLARILRATLDASALPPGFSQAEWDDLNARITRGLDTAIQAADGEKALNLYKLTYADYLSTLTRKLQGLIATQRTQQADNAEEYSALDTLITQVDQALAAGQLHQAAQSYDAAKASYEKIKSTSARAKGPGATTPALADAVATSNLSEPAQAGEVATPPSIEIALPLPRTTRGVISALLVGDLVRLIITVLVAVLIGLLLLWVDNPTWGDAKDLIVALLWGFGLHQLSAATFEGVNSLPGRLWGTTS